jgi:MYXO-CTERM domain-containing protein
MRFASLLAVCLVAHSATASAHIEMKFPTPRTTDQKIGPCGPSTSTRGTKVSTFRPGETITVEWDETVDHPGHYRIAFDDDGSDVFQDPKRPDDKFPSTLADQIVDRSGGHYSQQITLPNITCSNCTLQLVQVMTTAVPYNSFYYQCADLVLAGDTEPMPSPSPEPSGGCAAGGAPGLGAGLAALALALHRRRRRR